jgi:hypothetical protein
MSRTTQTNKQTPQKGMREDEQQQTKKGGWWLVVVMVVIGDEVRWYEVVGRST